jgi:hypothetical protein
MELNDSLLRPLLNLDVTPDGAGGGGFRGLCSVELFTLSIPVRRETKTHQRVSRDIGENASPCKIHLSNVPCPVDESPLGDLL